MSNFHIYCETDELTKGELARLENAMDGFVTSDAPLAVEFAFVDGDEIRRLNKELRSVDKVTDVLSFPTLDDIKGEKISKKDFPFDINEDGCVVIGSIAVCLDRAREQAEEYGHSFERELYYLLVHGIMHCLGYDHEQDDEKAEMREREEYILGKLGITRGD